MLLHFRSHTPWMSLIPAHDNGFSSQVSESVPQSPVSGTSSPHLCTTHELISLVKKEPRAEQSHRQVSLERVHLP